MGVTYWVEGSVHIELLLNFFHRSIFFAQLVQYCMVLSTCISYVYFKIGFIIIQHILYMFSCFAHFEWFKYYFFNFYTPSGC